MRSFEKRIHGRDEEPPVAAIRPRGFSSTLEGVHKRRSDRQRMFWSVIFGLALVGWGSLHLVFGCEIWGENVRRVGYRLKNYVGAFAVAVMVALAVVQIFRGRLRLRPRALHLIALASIFPLVASWGMLANRELLFPLMAMYMLWAAYYFFVWPAIGSLGLERLIVIKSIWWGVGLVIAGGIGVGLVQGILFWRWSDRLCFAFHPNIYGQALGMFGAASVVLAVSLKERCYLYWGACGASIVLLWLGVSRSYMAFLVVFILAYFATRARERVLWGIALVTVVIASLLIVPEIGEESLDRTSSRRIFVAKETFKEHWVGQGEWKWLIGVHGFLSGEGILATEEAASARFQKSTIDNTYLSTLLAHGLLGVVGLVLPFAFVFSWHWRRANRRNGESSAFAIAAISGLAITGLVQATIPSLGSGFAILLPAFFAFCPEDRCRTTFERTTTTGESRKKLVARFWS